MSIDTRKRMSLAQKKRVIEGRNHLWKGGIKSQEQKERSKMLREQYRLTHKKEANGRAVARRKTDIQ